MKTAHIVRVSLLLNILGLLMLSVFFYKEYVSSNNGNTQAVASASFVDEQCSQLISNPVLELGQNPHPEAFVSCAGYLE